MFPRDLGKDTPSFQQWAKEEIERLQNKIKCLDKMLKEVAKDGE